MDFIQNRPFIVASQRLKDSGNYAMLSLHRLRALWVAAATNFIEGRAAASPVTYKMGGWSPAHCSYIFITPLQRETANICKWAGCRCFSGGLSQPPFTAYVPYTLSIRNYDSYPVSGVVVTDDLQAEIEFVPGSIKEDGVARPTATLPYTITTIPANSTVTLAFDVKVKGSAVTGTIIENTAKIIEINTQTLAIPVEALSDDVTVQTKADMTVTKNGVYDDTNGDGNTNIGDTITYTVTVTNTGNVSLTNVAVSDPKITLTPSSGDTNDNGVLDVGEVWIYTGIYNLTQDDINAGKVENTVSVTTTEITTPEVDNEITKYPGPKVEVDDKTVPYDGLGHKSNTPADLLPGDVVYYSTNGGETWSNSIPEFVDYKDGGHEVRIKVVNPNYDTDRVTTTKVTITKKPITITADSDTKVYDGSPLTKNSYTAGALASGQTLDTVVITGSQTDVGSSDNVASGAVILDSSTNNVTSNYEITYAKGALTVTKAPATNNPVTVTDYTDVYDGVEHGVVVNGATSDDTVTYSIDGGTTWITTLPENADVGEYDVKVKVENPNYEDKIIDGKVTITKKPLTITADTDSKVYDGTPLTKDSYTAGALAAGQTLDTVVITGSQTDVGNSANVASGAVILDSSSKDVTSNYDVTYADGTLTINKRDITITADSAEKVYDGSPLIKESATASNIVSGQTFHAKYTGSQTVVGVSSNVASEAHIYDASSNDVTNNYNITYQPGTLKVTKADALENPVTVEDYTGPYDGDSHGVIINDLTPDDTVYYWDEDANDWTTVEPRHTNVCVYPVKVKIVNPNYEDKIMDAIVKITKRPINVIAVSDLKVYDGTPLVRNEATADSLVTGQVLFAVDVVGSQTAIGSSANVASNAVIHDAFNNDVTSNYAITYVDGKLTVDTVGVMTATAPDVVKEYDALGHGITVTPSVSGAVVKYWNDATNAYDLNESPEIVNVNDGPKTVKYRVTAPNYLPIEGSATVTITPKEVVVTAGSAIKVYDGSALINNSATASGLLSGHTLNSVVVTGSQTVAGSSANVASAAVIADALSNDVTSNYNVKYQEGKLTVTALGVMVVNAPDVVETYDGTAYGIVVTPNVSGATIKYWNEVTKAYDLDNSPAIADVDEGPITVKYLVTKDDYASVEGSATVTILPKKVTLTTDSATKPYDGTPLENPGYNISGLLSGHAATVTVTGSQTAVGVGDNVANVNVIMDGLKDVTNNYDVEYVFGKLTVTDLAEMSATADNVVKVYDGNPYGIEVVPSVPGSTVKYWNETTNAYDLLTSPTKTDVSGGPLTVKYQVTQDGYKPVTGEATVTIIPKPITVTAKSATQAYDGNELTAPTATVSGVVAGHKLGTVDVVGGQTAIGTSDNIASNAVILDASDKDVSTNYDITYKPGKLTVTGTTTGTILVEVSDVTKVYDGTGYGITPTTNVAGAIIKYWDGSDYTLDSSPTQTDVGTKDIKFKVTAPGYDDVFDEATVTILPRVITVTSGSATKVYDGNPLLLNEANATGLASTHILKSVTVNGSQTAVGESANTMATDAVIEDGSTNNVTANYIINYVEGKLVVTNGLDIQVEAPNVTKEYDGTGYGIVAVPNVPGAVVKYWDGFGYTLDESPKQEDVGILEVKYQVTAPGYPTKEGSATVTITPKTAYVTAASAIKEDDGNPLTAPTAYATGLLSGQNLDSVVVTGTQAGIGSSANVASGAVIKAGTKDVTANYNIVYVNGDLTIKAVGDPTLGTMLATAPDVTKVYDGSPYGIVVTPNVDGATVKYWDGADYTLDESPKQVDVGSLPVKYKVTKPGYTDVEGTATVTITKRDVVITAASATKVDDGFPLSKNEAFASGLVDGQTVKSVVVSGTLTSVGSISNEATNAIIEDALGNDVTANYNIIYKPGILTITGAAEPVLKIEVQAPDVVLTYDGQDHGIVVTADVSGAVVRFFDETTGDYTLPTSPVQNDVGSKDVKYQVSKPGYPTVTGTAKVTVNPKGLVITAGSAIKPYDGTPLTSSYHSANGLVSGHTVTALAITGSQTDAGSSANTAASATIMAGGKDVTNNYNITYKQGTLTVTPYGVMVVEAPNVIKEYDGTGYGITVTPNVTGATVLFWNNATNSYNLTVSPTQTEVSGSPLLVKYLVTHSSYANVEGQATVTITPKPITITAESAHKPFDGSPLTHNKANANGLLSGHDLDSVVVTGSQTAVGTANNVPSNAKIVDASNVDVTSNYAITYVNGKLTVTDLGTMTVEAPDVVKEYDKTPYGITVTTSVPGATVLFWNDVTSAYDLSVSPTKTDVGSGPKTVKYQVTAAGYNTVTGEAKVTITPKDITVLAGSATKAHDGNPLTENSAQAIGLLSGHTLATYTVNGSQTAVGTSNNNVSNAKILEGGKDVTGNYAITYQAGKLTVTGSGELGDMVVVAPDVIKEYDGNGYGITVTPNVPGATILYWNDVTSAYDLPVSPTKTDVSGGPLTVGYQVTAPGFKTVTGTATVTITPRKVMVTAASATKVQDGTPITKNEAVASGLLSGHTMNSVTVTGSQTLVGTSANIATNAKFVDGLGSDVTSNYDITYKEGKLSITVLIIINTPPIARDDDAITDVNMPVTINVLSNDSDADGDVLAITSVGAPTNGTAVISGGQITYTPKDGFSGIDTFTYTISDGKGGSATATVTVIVSPYRITITPDPASIVGNGRNKTLLTAQVTDAYGTPVPNVKVDFYTSLFNTDDSFIGLDGQLSRFAYTDANGIAQVYFKSTNLESLSSEPSIFKPIVFQVFAEANDDTRDLHTKTSFDITFVPGTLHGVLYDNGKVMANQKLTITLQNGGRVWTETIYTNDKGEYETVVPWSGETYSINFTKPVQVVDANGRLTTVEVPFTQKGTTDGAMLGEGGKFASDKTISGLVLHMSKEKDTPKFIEPKELSKYGVELYQTNAAGVMTLVGTASLGTGGTYTMEDLPVGTYTVVVTYKTDTGQVLIAGRQIVTISDDGQMSITEVLIDPYGTITDKVTGDYINNAKVTLYYADTPRNRANPNVTPHAVVILPPVIGFEPNDNGNPDYDADGFYAFMVYEETDYYVIAEADGYVTYNSGILSVYKEILRHDIKMVKIGGPEANLIDLAVALQSNKTKIARGEEAEFTLTYANKSALVSKETYLEVTIPAGMSFVSAEDGGTLNGNKIVWELGTLAAKFQNQVKFVLKAEINGVKAEEIVIVSAEILSRVETIINLIDDTSTLNILLYSPDYEGYHERYIKGYPDGEVKAENNITRAEVAAIFARILHLEGLVKGESYYADTKEANWAAEYIEAVTKINLFKGYADGNFKPNQAITRAELATVIARYLGIAREQNLDVFIVISDFSDISSSWAAQTIEELFRSAIITGYEDGTFKPNISISRAEAITMVNRMLHRGPLTNVEPSYSDNSPDKWYFGHVEEATRTHRYTHITGGELMTEFIPERLW